MNYTNLKNTASFFEGIGVVCEIGAATSGVFFGVGFGVSFITAPFGLPRDFPFAFNGISSSSISSVALAVGGIEASGVLFCFSECTCLRCCMSFFVLLNFLALILLCVPFCVAEYHFSPC